MSITWEVGYYINITYVVIVVLSEKPDNILQVLTDVNITHVVIVGISEKPDNILQVFTDVNITYVVIGISEKPDNILQEALQTFTLLIVLLQE